MKEYNIKTNINKNIFRGYDIRGVYGKDIDEDVAYTIGLSFGTYVLNNGYDKCVVGYDNRVSSIDICNALTKGITDTGLNVDLINLVTTPMFYFAQYIDIENKTILPGMMITASHNPKEYNGFKFAFNNFGNACGKMVQDFRRFTEKGKFAKGNGVINEIDITNDYLNLVKNSIDLGKRKIKVVVDTANGTASIIAKKMYEMFDGIELIPLYMDSNPDFPNHHPDPSVEANNLDLSKKVLKEKADLGIGIDGDGDRIGVVDEKGKMIYLDLLAIIIWRHIYDKVNNKNALFDVKCSKSLPDELIKLGLNPICYRTGNSYIKAKMKEDNLDFGIELAGHVFFNDKWPNIDDGLYVGLRLIEILSKTDKNISELLNDINLYYSTEEYRIDSSDNIKFDVIENVKKYCINKGYDINTIDGVRAEFSDGWALVRVSNTGPVISARFEGSSKERLEEIKKEFLDLIGGFNVV